MDPEERNIVQQNEQQAAVSDEALRDLVLAALEDSKAEDPAVLDVRGKTGITDFMIIVSGTSNRHLRSIADTVVEQARKQGVRPLGVEGVESAEWILVDLADVVVHIMLPRVRDLYRLERIWGFGEDEAEQQDGG